MSKLTAQEFAEKWNRRLASSLEDVRAGIDRVTIAPTTQAAAKKDKMRSRVVDAIDSGKWERGLKRVSLEDWKNKTKNKGLSRIASGAEESKGKMADFGAELLPYIDSGQQKLSNMPDLTLQDSIARSSAWITHMSQFRRGGKSR